MAKRDRAVFALVLGAGLGWLFLLDTGLALTVAVIALAVMLAWHVLGWLEKWGKREQE